MDPSWNMVAYLKHPRRSLSSIEWVTHVVWFCTLLPGVPAGFTTVLDHKAIPASKGNSRSCLRVSSITKSGHKISNLNSWPIFGQIPTHTEAPLGARQYR